MIRNEKDRGESTPPHVEHASFLEPEAAVQYCPDGAPSADSERALGHLPDDDTRDLARRMHYAAYRASRARTEARRRTWKGHYFALRDRIILGNRKLVFRAIRNNPHVRQLADDLIGECDVIMIRAVAAYNPWLGIRFSTYAFTCLMRGLARLSRRIAARKLLNFLPLETAAEEALAIAQRESPFAARPVEEFLRAESPLLSEREKTVVGRRFGVGHGGTRATLETLGADLGLSKERVRQVQESAFDKLRSALGSADA